MKKGKTEILKEWVAGHKYSYAMLYLVFYLVAFFVLDFTMEPKYILHCALDDQIPFCEYFVIFYFAWYPAFFLSLVWYMLRDKRDFQQLWFIMFNGITFCLICYVLFPNGLNLREEVPNRNIFCVLVNLVRGVDAAVNVCPSIHVSSSVSIALVTAKSNLFKEHKWRKAAIILLMILISISTLFVKQHSVIDVVCGAAVSLVLYVIAYHTNWRKLLKDKLKVLL
ncbi:MAG: phosphatase PAP2 family protein [Lachnospiraceae bacterium]|nr:phosphatase PAP2 family protein [Lachnospiraceae bacterium]